MSVTTAVLDLARDPGLPLVDLESFLSEARTAPSWRMRAEEECDYYDSNQHTAEEVATAEARGLPIVTINLIAPTIDLILGMEAKTRTDWTCKPDGPNVPDEYAEALTVKLQEAERITYADSACADAYAGQIKAGIGWVYVGRNIDPFKYPYKVQNVDRREIWWDMRSEDRGLDDARWLVRRKWHDTDYLKALFPQTIGGTDIHHMIDFAMDSTAQWDHAQFARSSPLMQDGLMERDWFSTNSTDWRDTERRRAMLYEVWYRHWIRGYTMKMPDGRVVEYQRNNLLHQAAVAAGAAMPVISLYSKVRLSWWLGPFRIYDVASPFPHDHFPYVPFFGYLEDRTKTPYGMIRRMRPMQDEVNARRAKMLWQLSAARVLVEEDAVVDHDMFRQEINRPDMYGVLRKDRRNASGGIKASIQIDEHMGLNAQQLQVYMDSKDTLQQTAGVYAAMLGDSKSGADAGVAIDMLIQQGTTTLAKINDNYRFARTLVGEQLLANINADMSGQPEEVKVPGKAGRPSKRVKLNEPAQTDEGLPYLNNDTVRLRARVALADVPSSPTYQAQVFTQLAQMVKALPPNIQAAVIDLVVEASNIPHKKEFADRIRQATGMHNTKDPQSMSPQERQEAMQEAQAAQAAAALKQAMEQLAMAEQASIVAKNNAMAAQAKAAAAAAMAKAGQITGTVIADMHTGDMQGTATVELEHQEEPAPGGPGTPTERDSTTLPARTN